MPNPVFTFDEANFPASIRDTLLKEGYTAPTPIQAQAWPLALSGKDFVGISRTGSGKTLGVSGVRLLVSVEHWVNWRGGGTLMGMGAWLG